MTETKPWYLSRTVWAALVAMAASLLGLAGLVPADFDQQRVVEMILQATTALAGLVALVGRLQARRQIGGTGAGGIRAGEARTVDLRTGETGAP